MRHARRARLLVGVHTLFFREPDLCPVLEVSAWVCIGGCWIAVFGRAQLCATYRGAAIIGEPLLHLLNSLGTPYSDAATLRNALDFIRAVLRKRETCLFFYTNDLKVCVMVVVVGGGGTRRRRCSWT